MRRARVLRKRLRRGQVLAFFSRVPRCLVGLEACATAHHWARELMALGHEPRLMPAHYVKAYVKRNKHDAADAEAICEAVVRPTMRFVAAKTAEQQAGLLLHRGRERLVRQTTAMQRGGENRAGSAVAMIGPMPGIVARRWLTGLLYAYPFLPSIRLTGRVNPRSWIVSTGVGNQELIREISRHAARCDSHALESDG